MTKVQVLGQVLEDHRGRAWWPTPLIPAHNEQRQVDLYELGDQHSMVYLVNSRLAKVTQ